MLTGGGLNSNSSRSGTPRVRVDTRPQSTRNTASVASVLLLLSTFSVLICSSPVDVVEPDVAEDSMTQPILQRMRARASGQIPRAPRVYRMARRMLRPSGAENAALCGACASSFPRCQMHNYRKLAIGPWAYHTAANCACRRQRDTRSRNARNALPPARRR